MKHRVRVVNPNTGNTIMVIEVMNEGESLRPIVEATVVLVRGTWPMFDVKEERGQ